MLTQKQTLDTLKSLGLEPKHGLGQNFLIDKNIVTRAVKLASLTPTDTVVEIGPGLGTLTDAILSTGASLTSIEKDTQLVPHLTTTFATQIAAGQWTLTRADATKIDYTTFAVANHDFKIVANLPYAVSSLLLEKFLLATPSYMILMLQKEMAERYIATSGKAFSALSIFLQSAYTLKIASTVPPTCFCPRPKVHSCLLELRRRDNPIIFSAEKHTLIRSLFLNRRKQIHKAAEAFPTSKIWFENLVSENLIAPTARAEEIPLELWQKLAGN